MKTRVDRDRELRMRHRNEWRVANDETEEMYSGQEGGRYIESEERQTKTH